MRRPHPGEGLPAPVPELGDALRDELRGVLTLAGIRLLHALLLSGPAGLRAARGARSPRTFSRWMRKVGRRWIAQGRSCPELRVDAEQVHGSVDIPLLGGLMGGPLASTLRDIVQKQLGSPKG